MGERFEPQFPDKFADGDGEWKVAPFRIPRASDRNQFKRLIIKTSEPFDQMPERRIVPEEYIWSILKENGTGSK